MEWLGQSCRELEKGGIGRVVRSIHKELGEANSASGRCTPLSLAGGLDKGRSAMGPVFARFMSLSGLRAPYPYVYIGVEAIEIEGVPNKKSSIKFRVSILGAVTR